MFSMKLHHLHDISEEFTGGFINFNNFGAKRDLAICKRRCERVQGSGGEAKFPQRFRRYAIKPKFLVYPTKYNRSPGLTSSQMSITHFIANALKTWPCCHTNCGYWLFSFENLSL
jgi:hypothetical protein